MRSLPTPSPRRSQKDEEMSDGDTMSIAAREQAAPQRAAARYTEVSPRGGGISAGRMTARRSRCSTPLAGTLHANEGAAQGQLRRAAWAHWMRAFAP